MTAPTDTNSQATATNKLPTAVSLLTTRRFQLAPMTTNQAKRCSSRAASAIAIQAFLYAPRSTQFSLGPCPEIPRAVLPMKAIRKLSDDQRRILISLDSGTPKNLALDDVMTLGGNSLIEFAKGGGIKLTKKGRKAVGLIERT